MISHPQPIPRSQRGSVLIVALIFSAAIAVSLGSYLRLGQQASELANRSLYLGAAMNASETGLEEAMWSLNQSIEGNGAAWNNWSVSGTAATRTFGAWTLSGGATAQAKVYVENYAGGASPPVVISRGIITPLRGAPIEKWVQVTTSKRSRFANGLVAKDKITMYGNTSVDSWNSDPDGNAGTPGIGYSSGVRRDNGSVGTISVVNAAVTVNNADIWGYASTGGDDPTDDVGPTGSILGSDSSGKDKSGWTKNKVDPDRIATDFAASFDPVETPTGGSSMSSITNSQTLGSTGAVTKLRLGSISISGNSALKVLGDVTLILTASSGTSALSITGNGDVIIPDGSSLTIYTEGNIAIAGNGVANGNDQPITMQIWGTSTTSQTIAIAGNGALKSVVYAPTAEVTINGNGDVMGSIVAKNIVMNGNAAFHYDESLAALDASEPLGIENWRELVTMADRTAYGAALNF